MEPPKRTMKHKFSIVSTSSDLELSDEHCGIGCFKPRWIQWCANPKVYLAIFCIIGVLQGAYFTYFIGIISTLERRYAFDSKISGLILIADNFGPIIGSVLIGYLGGQAHRPRLMSVGMTLVVASCFLSTLPYFIYGPQVHPSSDTLISDPVQGVKLCDETTKTKECLDSTVTNTLKPAILIFFLANFLNGFGYIAYYTVGTPYLDDSIAKEDFPLYISVSGAMRILGPTVGFLLSSLCLRYYEDPYYDPGFFVDNQRWIGAWWLGFIILGVMILFFALLLSLFPRNMPRKSGVDLSTKDKDSYTPKLKDFPKALKRLVGNPMLVCQALAFMLHINGYLGYFMFIPKYMEIHYRQFAAHANLISGSTTTVSILLGIIVGGLAIRLFKPLPRQLTGSIVVAQLIAVFGLFVTLFLGCPSLHLPGTEITKDHLLELTNVCNSGCQCTQSVFEPVCGPDGKSTYFSPCFAGCTDFGPSPTVVSNSVLDQISTSSLPPVVNNSQMFHNCRCVHDNQTAFVTGSVTSGYCGPMCATFLPYVLILCITMFVSSTSRVGSSVITMRCVDPEDKSFAMGGIGSFLALFALLPCPLIFGALTDSACVVWEENCGVPGNCWLYDANKLRYNLHGMAITLILLGTVFDVAIFFLSGTLCDLYGDPTAARHVQYLNDEEDEDVIYFRESKNTRKKINDS